MEKKEEARTDWHKLFVGAFILDMHTDREKLAFQQETEIGREPPRTDLIVIRKEPEAILKNEIGQIFRTHNLIEYKSPADHLDIKAYYKGIGYAGFYIGSETSESNADPQEVTLTFIRSSKPVKLMRQLRDDYDCVVREVAAGVYYVEGRVLFPTQIIVTDELSQEGHAWMKAIGGKEPGAELYRKVAYRSGIESAEEKAYIRDIMRFLHERFEVSFEQFFKEEAGMGRTLEDFANEIAELHIQELKEDLMEKDREIDQFRQENDQFRQENDRYRNRIAELEAQLAAVK